MPTWKPSVRSRQPAPFTSGVPVRKHLGALGEHVATSLRGWLQRPSWCTRRDRAAGIAEVNVPGPGRCGREAMQLPCKKHHARSNRVAGSRPQRNTSTPFDFWRGQRTSSADGIETRTVYQTRSRNSSVGQSAGPITRRPVVRIHFPQPAKNLTLSSRPVRGNRPHDWVDHGTRHREHFGCLAQLVEQGPYKTQVGGSIPSAPTKLLLWGAISSR